MTLHAPDVAAQHLRNAWVARVGGLVDQISKWSEGLGWSTHRGEKEIDERGLGPYMVPTLRIRTPQGEVHVNPIARHVMGAEGRVDLEAWPSLNRVRLVPLAGDQWRIITDSNVSLKSPWNPETFVDVTKELCATS